MLAFIRFLAPVAAFIVIGNTWAQVTTGPPSMASPALPLSPAPGWFVGPHDTQPAPPLSRNPNAYAPVGVGRLNAFASPPTLAAPPSTGPMPPLTRNPQAIAPVVTGPINPWAPPAGW